MTRGPTRGRKYDERHRQLTDAEIAAFIARRQAERAAQRQEQLRRSAELAAEEVATDGTSES